jgi:hypothetical protein
MQIQQVLNCNAEVSEKALHCSAEVEGGTP